MAGDYEARARALVGRRFRLQGRGEGGLDCIGVVLLTFGIDPARVRRDYRLRSGDRAALEHELNLHFRRVGRKMPRTGDVLLMSTGERQLHLAVRTSVGFVHAHAGIGRVVETPGAPAWKVLACFRRRVRTRRS